MTEIARSRPLSGRWSLGALATACVGLAWLALAAFWAVPAILTVDALIYRAMIDAFARDGSLFVQNGYPEYRAEGLGLRFLRPAEGGLAPQYPGGWGILAAPAYLAAGTRGVIVLNALASALTLPLVWLAARALLDDRRVATHAALIYGLASFAVDYALGVWPHGVTTFLVAAALAAAAQGWRAGGAGELRGALLAGLALGIGVNIRVDALIVAVPLAVWLLGAGRRPYAAAGALLAGLAPGLAAATAINQLKFGIPSPLTYGGGGGATSLGYYAALAPMAAAGALGALALGLERVRAALYRPRGLALAALGLAALGLALPATREVLLRMAAGFWVLVVDFQAHPLPSVGLVREADGTITAFGALKKALLQSLPYAAVILVLAPRLWRGPGRAGLALCLLVVALVIAPFAYGSWHGGAAKNMRYLLNLVPALAILSAAALARLAELAGERPAPAPGRAALIGVIGATLLYGALSGYRLGFILEVTLANAVALAATGLALAVLLARGAARQAAAAALRTVAVLGLVLAFCSAWVFDLRVTQNQRATNLAIARAAADLPHTALVVTYTPEFVPFRLNRPPAMTAQADPRTLEVAPDLADLVARVLAEGRPVFAQSGHLAGQLAGMGLAADAGPRFGLPEPYAFHELVPPGTARQEQGEPR